MSVSDQELLHHLSRMPFVDTAELAMISGEAHIAMHRGLTGLLSDGIVGRVSHRGTELINFLPRYGRRPVPSGQSAGIPIQCKAVFSQSGLGTKRLPGPAGLT